MNRAPYLPPIAAALALATTALALGGCSPKSQTAADAAANTPSLVTLTPAQDRQIRITTAVQSSFFHTIEAIGVVDFDQDHATSVLAPMSGPVARLLVDAGQTVKAGQILAVVDSPDYATAVSTYRKADLTARNARRLADADRDLAQHNGVSAREAEQAQTDAASAEADRDAAIKGLTSLGFTTQTIADIQQGKPGAGMEGDIRSPVAGTVVEKLITPGLLLQAGTTPAFTVANLSNVWVQAQVTPADASAIAVGDTVEVETGGSPATVKGVLDNVSAQVNPDTRAVLARVVTPNPGGVLKKQMYVRVQIKAKRPSAGLLIPVSAVLRDEENLPFVYVAGSGGYARRAVTIGPRVGDAYEIPQGLQAGDRVVADGAVFLQFIQDQ